MVTATGVPAHWRSSQGIAPDRKTRVLIVDDSVVARRIITHVFSLDESVEVVGSAATAERALEKIPQLQPDVLTLDINMPGMSGLELLPILKERFPQLHVLVLTACGPSSAANTVEALMLGASDCISKPTEDASLGDAVARLQAELLPKIKHLSATPTKPPRPAPSAAGRPSLHAAITTGVPEAVPVRVPRVRSTIGLQILAVGVSTGGPTALSTFMAGIPASFPIPIVIVQHMPPVFTRLLADRLRTVTGINVVEGTHGMLCEAGKAIIAPGDYHMRLARSNNEVRIVLDQGPQECSCRPSVDVLFRSVDEVYGNSAIATVLTGMGQDGLRGAEIMKKSGIHIIVQDEASSVVWGMPGAIANKGLADEILDIHSIAGSILRKVGM